MNTNLRKCNNKNILLLIAEGRNFMVRRIRVYDIVSFYVLHLISYDITVLLKLVLPFVVSKKRSIMSASNHKTSYFSSFSTYIKSQHLSHYSTYIKTQNLLFVKIQSLHQDTALIFKLQHLYQVTALFKLQHLYQITELIICQITALTL